MKTRFDKENPLKIPLMLNVVYENKPCVYV